MEMLSSTHGLQLYSKMDEELNKAIGHDAKLSEMVDRHTDYVVSRVAVLLRHFGSSWPEEKLRLYS